MHTVTAGRLWIDWQSNDAIDSTPFRFTGKERNKETGLYYFGARYLDPKTSRWLSTDPAMYQGDYIPSAPMNDQARRRNGNLAGMGGVFNYVNLHVYHYGGNNPIKYVDPDGRADDRIHRGDRDRGVYRWAREAGFNEARSARIANANNSVDYGSTGYLPGEDPSRHFNTNIVDSGTPIDSRIGNAQSNLKESIRLKNLAMSLGEDSASFTSIMNHSLDLLGIAGHLLIDVAFHTDSVVGVIAGVHFHFPGFDIDNPDARPDSVNCAEWMIKGTFEMWDKGVYDPNHEIWNPSLNWDGFDGL